MTTYPFPLASELRPSLPQRSSDGNWYVDIKVDGKWDGVLVIDESFHCIGIYVHRTIQCLPLPFEPQAIEELRPPCNLHWFLAGLPAWLDIWWMSVAGILIISPAIIFLAHSTTTLLALLVIPTVVASLVGMYSFRGFPLIRLPVAITGVIMVIEALRTAF